METSINVSKNLPYIIILCGAGAFFMILAFLFLSVVLVVPHKFSLLFALGGGCFLGAIALARGPDNFIKSMGEGEKLKLSIVYGASILGTLAGSLAFKSNIISLAFAIAQVIFSLKIFEKWNR